MVKTDGKPTIAWSDPPEPDSDRECGDEHALDYDPNLPFDAETQRIKRERDNVYTGPSWWD